MGRLVLFLVVMAVTNLEWQSRCVAQQTSNSEEQLEFFENHIRPVLVEHCYACHNSHDSTEGGLAVDHAVALFGGGDGGALISPGDPSSSRLISILKHEIEGLEMPEDGAKLDAEVIGHFETWIAAGAIDPRSEPPTAEELVASTYWDATLSRRIQWWSFRPIADPVVPDLLTASVEVHPIDRFVRARLVERGLEPAPPAAPQALIRRLYLTLIGLPPSVEELETWLARYQGPDDRSIATAELVDQLLESEHFGERWARHWMDWIRYAESHGSEGDPRIHNAWVYRDYLIRALNSDVPYDQLIREHVAGDLLASPRVNRDLGVNESIAAVAHWRMNFHGFAPTDALDEKVRFVDDQVNTFSKAFLGLTVSCARCHDHKFDAISQQDYYALFGILASCRPGRTTIDLPEIQLTNRRALKSLKVEIREAAADAWLDSMDALPEHLVELVNQAKEPIEIDSILHPISLIRNANDDEALRRWARLTESIAPPNQDSQEVVPPSASASASASVLTKWDFASRDQASDWTTSGIGLDDQPAPPGEFSVASDGDAALRGIYPGGIYSHLISDKHAARLTSPDITLTEESEVWLRVIGDGGSSNRYVVHDYPRNGTVYPVRKLKPEWSWQRFDMSYWTGDQTHLEVVTARDAPLLVEDRDRSWFGVTQVKIVKKGSAAPKSVPGYLTAIVQAGSEEQQPSSLSQLTKIYQSAIRNAILDWRSNKASDAQARLLDDCLRAGVLTNSLAKMPSVASLVKGYRSLESEIPVATRVPALQETPGRTQPLYVRGDHRKPGEIVPRRFLEAIDASVYTSPGSGRLELADDLIREDNPLTRRVIVNRLWHHLFGRGIVATPDNMGRMGEQPTHPELLDWLACRLVEDEWSLKSMVRRIVSSETWQQSAQPSAAAMRIDPNNQYVSHANLRRLEAEAIRDSLLAVSGQLDLKLFGPSVNGNSNRRSIYVSVIRNSLDPFLRAFDFPEPFSATGRRDVTNVPAQSLTMMNDALVERWATHLASSLLDHSPQTNERPGDQERLQRLFLTLFSRPPEADESEEAITYLKTTRQSQEESRNLRIKLKRELSKAQSELSKIEELAKTRVSENSRTQSNAQQQADDRASNDPAPEPIAKWNFDGDLTDSVGSLHGTAHGEARTENGSLIVGNGSYVTTPKLVETLKAKTLEASVRLDDLQQKGGGVISLQTSGGKIFDAIVFGEMRDQRWIAGSDNFKRTQSFEGPAEKEATDQTVHLAIAYHEDGRIVAYRNGIRYGNAYQRKAPITFEANDSVIAFGLRHFPAGGNRMLSGRIEQAAIYNRALSDAEVALSYRQTTGVVPREQLLAALEKKEREELISLEHRLNELQTSLESLAKQQEPPELAAWKELTRAMLLLKEFIYVP